MAHYLDPSSKPRITAVVERELLATHMRGLLGNEETGFVAMLREDQADDLSRLYTLLARVEGGHKLMMDQMAMYATVRVLMRVCV